MIIVSAFSVASAALAGRYVPEMIESCQAAGIHVCSVANPAGPVVCDAVPGDPSAEICDGSELGGQDCASLGLGGGTLACAPACDAFDTSACYVCGNGAVEASEECDGGDMGGATCSNQGFDGGAIACNADCTLLRDYCGNSIVEPSEVCDDGNLIDGDGCDSDCGMEPDADGDDWPDDNDCGPEDPTIYPCNPDEVDEDGEPDHGQGLGEPVEVGALPDGAAEEPGQGRGQ